jgi:hypothetical protein
VSQGKSKSHKLRLEGSSPSAATNSIPTDSSQSIKENRSPKQRFRFALHKVNLNLYLFGENKMSDGGKGSKPRPLSVANEEYASRWDAIFNRDSETDKPTRNNQETQQVQNFEVDNSGKSLL